MNQEGKGLKAGSELDALVAERVMGLTKPGCGWGSGENGRGSFWNFPLRPYSTEIATAWEVVDNLRTKGFEFAVSTCRFSFGFQCTGTTHFWASFGKRLEPIESTQGDTPAHAICLAALKAVGVSEETKG